MINKNKKQIKLFNIITDAVIIFLSYFISLWLKFSVMHGSISINMKSSCFIVGVIILSILLPVAYYLFKPQNRAAQAISIAFVNAIGILIGMALLFLYRINDFSRDVLVLFWLISSLFVSLKHIIGKRIAMKSSFGYAKRRIVIIGSGVHARQYVSDIMESKRDECIIEGYFGSEYTDNLGTYLGAYSEFSSVIPSIDPDEIIIALEADETEFIRPAIDIADKEGIHVSMIPFYSDYIPAHPEIENIGKSKLINLRATPLDSFGNSLLKRATDIIGSALMLLVLSPLMLFAALGVKLSSSGPVFFRQERIGKDKKPFMMLKFRSMRVNAEENTAWSTDTDPRKTKFGTFIRKYSIDELPQLFNVLMGDMSLIGPRPEIPFYVRQFKETVPLYLVRQQVRPGMTGWAQVHGLRGDTSIEDRVEYDIWYIENWSFWLDVKILFMTVFGGKFKNSEH